MKLISKLFGSTASLALLAGSISPATAIPYSGNTTYMAGTGLIVFSATANTELAVQVERNSTTAKLVGACGEVRISASSVGTGKITLTNADNTATELNFATLPLGTLPSCVGNTLSESVPNAFFKTNRGEVVLTGLTVKSLPITVSKMSNQIVKINACGFGTIKAGATKIAIAGGTPILTSTLAAAGPLPLCVKDISYVPFAWMP
jgi:hypothetical protein